MDIKADVDQAIYQITLVNAAIMHLGDSEIERDNYGVGGTLKVLGVELEKQLAAIETAISKAETIQEKPKKKPRLSAV